MNQSGVCSVCSIFSLGVLGWLDKYDPGLYAAISFIPMAFLGFSIGNIVDKKTESNDNRVCEKKFVVSGIVSLIFIFGAIMIRNGILHEVCIILATTSLTVFWGVLRKNKNYTVFWRCKK